MLRPSESFPFPTPSATKTRHRGHDHPITALVLTMAEHRLRPGEWLAQTAAGSTVGRLALQLARSEGFRTLNLVRRSAQVAEITRKGDRLRGRSGRRRRGARTAARPRRCHRGGDPLAARSSFGARSRPSVRALAFGRRASPGRRAGSRIGLRRLRDGRSTAARYRPRHKANVAAN